jgi:hypothetical protein
MAAAVIKANSTMTEPSNSGLLPHLPPYHNSALVALTRQWLTLSSRLIINFKTRQTHFANTPITRMTHNAYSFGVLPN